MVFSGVLTAVIALVLKYTMGWRITEADERAGIDISQHAEAGYDLVGALASRRERGFSSTSSAFPEDAQSAEPRNAAPDVETSKTTPADAAAEDTRPVTSGEPR